MTTSFTCVGNNIVTFFNVASTISPVVDLLNFCILTELQLIANYAYSKPVGKTATVLSWWLLLFSASNIAVWPHLHVVRKLLAI